MWRRPTSYAVMVCCGHRVDQQLHLGDALFLAQLCVAFAELDEEGAGQADTQPQTRMACERRAESSLSVTLRSLAMMGHRNLGLKWR